MNGSSAVTHPINEQLIGKFHVTNLEKPIVHQHHPPPPSSEDISMQRSVSVPDEATACASRFQMIRVDRNFGRGRWKVNDYEPPENTTTSTISSVNANENESTNNNGTFFNVQPGIPPMTSTNLPAVVNGDASVATSTALTATAVSAAVATATAFQQQQQQQQQQRMALNNTSTVVPSANVPPPTGLLHGYPSGPIANQPYLLPSHHPQFGYYHFYPPPYSHYAPPWTPAAAAALAAANPYLQPGTMAPPVQQQMNSQLSTNANVTDPDNNVENGFPNSTTDPLPNAQLSAYLFALQHSHPPYAPQTSSGTSTYATIPSYHPVPSPHPSILPPQTLLLSQNLSNTMNDMQQSFQVPVLASPKNDAPKGLPQQSSLITPKTKPLIPTGLNGANNDPNRITHMNDLISSSPALTTAQPAPPSFISPITISATNAPTASLSDLWSYTTAGSPLNLTQTAQTAAVTAVTAMGLLNNETTSQNTEMANEILKELTTPTKQNNTADIDNKISAAMDLVKAHLLSAVREEVTELRQQIRVLNEKLSNAEHENAFLRQHVSSEIHALYNPTNAVLSSSNDSTSSITMNAIPLISSSQPMPISSLPSALISQGTFSNSNLP